MEPTYKEIWDTFRSIDVKNRTETIGGGGGRRPLTYLSWAWAWVTLMEHFPQAEVTFDTFGNADGTITDIMTYPDGSSTVQTTVQIGECTRSMRLAVMDHTNKAIKNPDATAVNKARMRCLTKNLALYGLGVGIFVGEDLPIVDLPSEPVERPPKRPNGGPAEDPLVSQAMGMEPEPDPEPEPGPQASKKDKSRIWSAHITRARRFEAEGMIQKDQLDDCAIEMLNQSLNWKGYTMGDDKTPVLEKDVKSLIGKGQNAKLPARFVKSPPSGEDQPF